MARLDICIPILLACALIPLAVANAQTPTTPAADPAATAAPETASDPAAERADLGEVNELVLEGSYQEADALLAGLQSEYPHDPALLLLRGEVLLALRKPEAAQPALEASLELDPDQPRASFQLATALNAQGKTDEALARFADATDSDDGQIKLMARLNRSTLFAQSRKWAEAAAELEAVLVLQPDDKQVYGDLASMYLRAGKTAETASALERGKQAGFLSAQHYYSLGARLYLDDQPAEAVSALTAALEIEPGMAKAERSLAASLEKLGREEEAMAHFRKYLDLAPNADDAKQIEAKIQRAKGSK